MYRGSRMYREVVPRGRNVTMLHCVPPGLVHYQIHRSVMTKDRFKDFSTVCNGNVLLDYGEQVEAVNILDKAPCHRSDNHRDMNGNFEIKKLPPYCPFLNPAGNATSSWKSAFKSSYV